MIDRQNGLQKVAFTRMHHLEGRLGMEIEQQLRDYDEGENVEGGGWLRGVGTTDMLRLISNIVMVGWVTVVLWRWLIYAGLFD